MVHEAQCIMKTSDLCYNTMPQLFSKTDIDLWVCPHHSSQLWAFNIWLKTCSLVLKHFIWYWWNLSKLISLMFAGTRYTARARSRRAHNEKQHHGWKSSPWVRATKAVVVTREGENWENRRYGLVGQRLEKGPQWKERKYSEGRRTFKEQWRIAFPLCTRGGLYNIWRDVVCAGSSMTRVLEV